jgi:hypothetical protein
MIDTTNRVLAAVEQDRLVPRASHALDRYESLLVDTLRIQRHTLRIQRRAFRIQQRQARISFESLAIQRELLGHTRSIDRKTGPVPPPTPVTP